VNAKKIVTIAITIAGIISSVFFSVAGGYDMYATLNGPWTFFIWGLAGSIYGISSGTLLLKSWIKFRGSIY